MRKLFFIIILYNPLGIKAQETPLSKLQQLTEERQKLYNDWKEASNQNSGLFGNKTKDDLKIEIDDLLKIIDKDNDILDELDALRQKEKGQLQNQYNDLNNQYNELLSQNEELKKRVAEHQNWSKENHSILEKTESKQLLFLSLFAVTLVSLIVLLVKYFNLKKLVN